MTRNITEGNQSQTNTSFLNVVEDTGTTYVGLPSSGILKSTNEANKLVSVETASQRCSRPTVDKRLRNSGS